MYKQFMLVLIMVPALTSTCEHTYVHPKHKQPEVIIIHDHHNHHHLDHHRTEPNEARAALEGFVLAALVNGGSYALAHKNKVATAGITTLLASTGYGIGQEYHRSSAYKVGVLAGWLTSLWLASQIPSHR